MQTVSIIREKFMKKIIVTFIATITAALLLCFSVSAFDNNDYGGGGGYDFGGGDYGGASLLLLLSFRQSAELKRNPVAAAQHVLHQ